jgi:DNA-binding IclR family transcriptional regulator
MNNSIKVKSLYKALTILECFTTENPEVGITEISEKLDLNKSNVYNIISTFEYCGYIQKNPKSNKYQLGVRILELSRVINSHLGFGEVVNPVIKQLAEEINEVVYFAIPKDHKVLYIEGAYPSAFLHVRTMLGETAEMYCTSLGKAMLAFMPADISVRIIGKQSMTAFTPNTITERRVLINELNDIRKKGYSIDNMEHEFGIKCVGVPVFNREAELVGAISISGPSLRFNEQAISDYAGRLTACAQIISMRF